MAPTRFDPARTHVFAVGVLEYDNGVHWPLDKRRDTVLLDVLRDRGVPESNITFLADKHATTKKIVPALRRTLKRAKPGDQLFFYFTGHGGRNRKTGIGTFKFRDAHYEVADLFTEIEKHFGGEAAIVTADCCYSGALPLQAPLRAGRVAYAAVGSSLSTLKSTGAWTFTNCWIDALTGEVATDKDGDGVLRLYELARHAEERLSFFNGQVCSMAVAGGMPVTFELGRAAKRTHARQGELVEARYFDGKKTRWLKAEIAAVRGKTLTVRWANEQTYSDLEEADLRAWTPTSLPLGKKVRVKSGKKWYPAKILAARQGMHLVRFDGWDSTWDEWVAPDKIR